jgi:hypothetical protein
MNTTSLTRDGMRVIGTSAVVLAATLAALLAVFVLAKPSEAADVQLTVEPSEVGFGEAQVDTTDNRTITIRNTGGTAVTIGAIKVIDPVTEEEITGGPSPWQTRFLPGPDGRPQQQQPPGARHQLRADGRHGIDQQGSCGLREAC